MEVTKKKQKNIPIMTQIRGMKVGEVLAFPTESVVYIRGNLSTYSLMLRRKYRSHINRERDCLEVIRES